MKYWKNLSKLTWLSYSQEWKMRPQDETLEKVTSKNLFSSKRRISQDSYWCRKFLNVQNTEQPLPRGITLKNAVFLIHPVMVKPLPRGNASQDEILGTLPLFNMNKQLSPIRAWKSKFHIKHATLSWISYPNRITEPQQNNIRESFWYTLVAKKIGRREIETFSTLLTSR